MYTGCVMYNKTLPAIIRCLIASNKAFLKLLTSISLITTRSIEAIAFSNSPFISSRPESSDKVNSSSVSLKKGWLGGSKARSSFDERLLVPLAPIPDMEYVMLCVYYDTHEA